MFLPTTTNQLNKNGYDLAHTIFFLVQKKWFGTYITSNVCVPGTTNTDPSKKNKNERQTITGH